jgi:hypothetical protein
VTAKLNTENFAWFWFKIYWKWMQGSLNLNPSQDKDKTHTPVKWCDLEGQQFNHWAVAGFCLQHHMCTAKQKHSTTKFQCERCKVMFCLHSFYRIYHTDIHVWSMGSLQHGKETTSRNVNAIHFNAIFCFISGIYKPFQKKMSFTSIK